MVVLRKIGASAVTALCAVSMTLGAVAPVTAMAQGTAGTGELLVESTWPTPHTLSAYKLMSGDVIEKDGSLAIHGVSLADGVSLDALTSVGCDAEDAPHAAIWLAEQINASDDGKLASAFARSVMDGADIKPVTTFETDEVVSLDEGYYLVMADESTPILTLIGDNAEGIPFRQVVKEKPGVPTVTKQVGEVSDKGEVTWGERCDAGAGDVVPYRLVGTMPNNIAAYDTYFYEFEDTFESGVAVDKSTVHVGLMGEDGKEVSDLTDKAVVNVTANGLTVTFEDVLMAVPDVKVGQSIEVTYEASLTDKATMGAADTNDNEVVLHYTKSPVTKEVGTSTPVEAHVLTWGIDVNKLDADSLRVLGGAEFTLQDSAGMYVNSDGTLSKEQVAASAYSTDSKGMVRISHLDAGSYTVTEVKAPDGYEKIGPFTIVIESDLSSEDVTMKASVKGEGISLSKVDVNDGVATVSVLDPAKGAPTSDSPNKTVVALQTGLETYGPYALTVLVAAGIAIVCVRRRKRED